MATIHGRPENDTRLKSAIIGFGATIAVISALAGAQFVLVPHTVAVVGRLDPDIDAWAVSLLRRQVVEFHAIVAAVMASYWLLCAVAGSGQLLRSRGANLTLALSGLIFALAMAIASFVPVMEALRGVCPILGISDTFPPPPEGKARFDGQTPCETFLQGAVPSFMLGLPTILLVSSAILRIVGSRRN